MIDVDAILKRTNLVSLVEQAGGRLHRAGGDLRGACPLHGGDNPTAFSVYSEGGVQKWKCFTRDCGGGDAIGFVMKWRGLDFRQACAYLSGGAIPETPAPRPVAQPHPAYVPPVGEWQSAARQALQECQAVLWQPKYTRVLDYLHGRGLKDDTIRAFKLGYCATGARVTFGGRSAGCGCRAAW